jgi:hypothetical protein
MTTNVINKGWFNPISLSVLLILVIVSAVLYVSKIINIPVFILLLLLSGLVASAIRIADQWERAVVLRMGKYNGERSRPLYDYPGYRTVCRLILTSVYG